MAVATCKSAPRFRHNHASTPPLSFLQAGCPSCHPTNAAIDRYLLPARPQQEILVLPAGPQQHCWLQSLLLRPLLRQTDRRMPYHFTDPAPHTMRAVSIVHYNRRYRNWPLTTLTLDWLNNLWSNCTSSLAAPVLGSPSAIFSLISRSRSFCNRFLH